MIIFDTMKRDIGIPKKKKRFDMEVGGVSGVGAGGSVGGVVKSQGASDNTPNAQSAGADTGPSQVENKDNGPSIDLSVNMDMSTQDYTSLRGMSESGESGECSDHDMKKLIELILAMKLLEEVNKSQQDQGGFSAIA
jgi:hypothetical protein